MGVQQNVAAFHRMWDAYATGRLEAMLDEITDDGAWTPIGSERSYVGHEQIRAWAQQVNRRFKSVTVVFGDMEADGEDCVVATGHVVMYDMSGNCAVDTDVGWVCEFRGDACITRMSAFAAHDEARRFASARSATPSPG